MRILTSLLLVVASLCSLANSAAAQVVPIAEFELPSVLSSGCVLQRNSRVPLWGRGQPGQNVSVQVSWSGKTYSGRVRPDGSWWIPIPTPDAGGPYQVALRCMKTDVVLENVLIGEVWVCSGQSNMEMPVAPANAAYTGIQEFEAALEGAANSQLRLFTVGNEISMTPQPSCEGEWLECSTETLSGFSATAYFFGLELQRELGVPVGLISADYGGSRAEAWMSAKGVAGLAGLERVGQLLGGAPTAEGVIAAAQVEAAREWAMEVARRDALVPSVWLAANDLELDSEWRGLLRCRFEVSPMMDGTFPDGFPGKEDPLPLPIEMRIRAGTPWCLVRVNGHVMGTNDLTQVPGEAARSLRIPASALHFGPNEIVVSLVSGGGMTALEDIGDLFVLEQTASVGSAEELESTETTFCLGLDLRDCPTPPNYRILDRATPTGLFNAMIAPIMPFGIRGVIWYQGESNTDRPQQYRSLFPALIRDWRGWWRQGDFPFYFVQLAPFAYDPDRGRPAELRDAQRDSLDVPNTGMAVTLDIGNAQDIHPKNKREVGRRLALWALAKDYGQQDLVYSGPLDTSLEIAGAELRVHFDHLGGGLVAAEGGLRHFELAGPDLRWHPATAEIDGDTVLVRSETVLDPRRVRYCGGAADEATLFNREGLPAPSFER